MISNSKLPAALLAAALCGAPVAYAATGDAPASPPPLPQQAIPQHAAAPNSTTVPATPNPVTPGPTATSTDSSQTNSSPVDSSPAAAALPNSTPTTPAADATAAPAPKPAKPKIHTIAFSDRVDRRDIPGFAKATLPLDQAIAAAEQASDGKAVAAVFRDRHGRPDYLVRVLKGGRILTEAVDAESGAAATHGRGVLLRHVAAGERAAFRIAAHEPMDL